MPQQHAARRQKDEGGFDGDAPTAILSQAVSAAWLFEKNADELRRRPA